MATKACLCVEPLPLPKDSVTTAGVTAAVHTVLINWRHSQQLGQAPGRAAYPLVLCCRAYSYLPRSADGAFDQLSP